MDEINKTAETSLTTLIEVSEPSLEKKGTDSDANFSSSWAETLLTLDSAIDEDYAISFHQEALESHLLLSTILNELEKSPVAFDMILGPFTNEIFSENKLEILSSLILVRPKSKKSLHIICKGRWHMFERHNCPITADTLFDGPDESLNIGDVVIISNDV